MNSLSNLRLFVFSLSLTVSLSALSAAPPADTRQQDAGTPTEVVAPPFSLGDEARIAAGKARFGANCAAYCHGNEGSGGKVPSFKGRKDFKAEAVFNVITHGTARRRRNARLGQWFLCRKTLGACRVHHVSFNTSARQLIYVQGLHSQYLAPAKGLGTCGSFRLHSHDLSHRLRHLWLRYFIRHKNEISQSKFTLRCAMTFQCFDSKKYKNREGPIRAFPIKTIEVQALEEEETKMNTQARHINEVIERTSLHADGLVVTISSPVHGRAASRIMDWIRLTPNPARVLESARLREHQDQLESFLRVARSGMEQLYKRVSPLGYVLLLTDAQGIAVDCIGNDQWDRELKHSGLCLGADWQEEHSGTSGVGTCIVERVPITCHQTDHFDATHINLTCTAAPLFDPTGEFLGVLDISALTSPSEKNSQHLAGT